MRGEARPPLIWEEKAGLVCLVLTSLQAFHELVFGGDLGIANLAPGSMLLVVLSLLVGRGVMNRYRNVWWWGAFLLGSIGFLLLAAYWGPIRAGLGLGENTSSFFAGEVSGWRLRRPSLSGFGLIWTISRTTLYFAASLLLILGEIRERVRSR